MVSSRRVAAGAAILCWVGGLALLAHRQGAAADTAHQLANAAARITPATIYYTVERSGHQVGFASSTIDTTANTITFTDYLLIGSAGRRLTVTNAVTLSRGLVLRRVEVAVDTGTGWRRASAELTADSMLHVVPAVGPSRSERVTRAPLVPGVVPLLMALGAGPKAGARGQYRVLDATAGRWSPVTFALAAESLFVVSDSAVLDSTAHAWRAATTDTVRAWKMVPDRAVLTGASALVAWIDDQGRIVDASVNVTGAGPLTIRRAAYEIAYRNWTDRRIDTRP